MRSTGVKVLAVSALAGAALAFTAVPGQADPTPGLRVVKTLSSSVVGPLQFAVDGQRVYVADSFTSTLSLIGSSTPIATGFNPAEGGDLAGVGVDPRTHAIAYTSSNGSHSHTTLTILAAGRQPVVADLSEFEATHNPDQVNRYGTDTHNACAIEALKKAGAPVSYTGQLDSHPYSVTSIGNGSWAVADAGGNDLLKVDGAGHVSVISVLPPQAVKVTPSFAAANGLPPCVVGITYKFEPVPTDVEVGPGGALYVTTLPGGPEGPDNGNPGSVYRIAAAGQPQRVATGFAGATNLAIDPRGNIYVAELSSGTIAQVVGGAPKTVATLRSVVAVEYANGQLYASTAPAVNGAHAPGRIVVLG